MPLGSRAFEEVDIDRAAEGFDAGRMAFKEQHCCQPDD